jgi:ribosomal protein S6
MLTNIVKTVSHEIIKGGGIVRSVHNHGIRSLPHRFQARFPDKRGNRYYYKGRFLSIYYDSNPSTMKQVEQLLKMDEEVLRNTHLKARSILDFANLREDRNPYIQQVEEEELKHLEAVKQRNETVESVIDDMRTEAS